MQYCSVHFREYPCTIRTINEIHKVRNNKKNIKKLGTKKINGLGQGFWVQGHSIIGMETNTGTSQERS